MSDQQSDNMLTTSDKQPVIQFDMNMNTWKDIYYKNEYLTSKGWFFSHVTGDTPSIYYAEYTDELPSIDFMIKNRINGYFQELMNVKNFSNMAHGRVIIDGKNIKFIWIFTTAYIPDDMKYSALYPCCKWEKITKDDTRFDTIMFYDSDTESIDYK